MLVFNFLNEKYARPFYTKHIAHFGATSLTNMVNGITFYITHNKSYTWFILPEEFTSFFVLWLHIQFSTLLIQLYVIILRYLLCYVILIYFGRLNHSSISSQMYYMFVYIDTCFIFVVLAHRIDNGTLLTNPHLSENRSNAGNLRLCKYFTLEIVHLPFVPQLILDLGPWSGVLGSACIWTESQGYLIHVFSLAIESFPGRTEKIWHCFWWHINDVMSGFLLKI